MTLSKNQIIGTKPRLKEVEVPEWGGSVYVRPMTILEQSKLADAASKPNQQYVDVAQLQMIPIIATCVVDENGQSLFTIEELESMTNFSQKSAQILQEAIFDLSGLTKKSQDELEKNSQIQPTEPVI
jgi:hypothetical protein